MIMRLQTRLAPLIAVLALASCGDDEVTDRKSLLDPQPLSMSSEVRGLSLLVEAVETLGPRLAEDAEFADNLVYTEQIYSEFAHARVGNADRASEPRFDVRTGAFYDNTNFDSLRAEVPNHYWVVDLHRLDRNWLVDWNGLERDEPEVAPTSLTFGIRASEHDGDYQEDLVERITGAFESADPRPASIIIGSELERHYGTTPGDWPLVVSAVHEIRDGLRAIDPAVRVGVGINWSNFNDTIVPRFVNAAEQSTVNYQVLEEAWDGVLGPLYYNEDVDTGEITRLLDFYAFSSVPDTTRYSQPSDIEASHYAGIPTFFLENPDKTLSVAWFALGWPVNSPSSDFWGRFFENFLETGGGYDIELVAWWGYGHLRDSECSTLTTTVGLPRSSCHHGLYTPSGSPVSGLRDTYFEDGQ